jgi:hypothetical protein
MKNYFLIIILISNYIFSEEYFLFSPIIPYPEQDIEFYSFLMDRNGEIKHIWEHDSSPASIPYLYENNILIRPSLIEFPIIDLPGRGGLIHKIDWLGEIIWEYTFSNELVQQHHDIEVLPNGNILLLAWEKKLQDEVIQKGKINHTGVLYIDMIVEIEPYGVSNANIVWEWHLWDHLVQDLSSEYDNYGVILDHPELLNINYLNLGDGEGPGPPDNENPDFVHCNAIHYNESLDQIILTSRRANEIFIIDHSTSIDEAMGHNGGLYGKGGDFLYRWGNPQNYNLGNSDNQILYAPHGANWVDDNYPGSGNIIIFNNGTGVEQNNFSSVIEIEAPLDINNNYIFEPGIPFLPDSMIINYNNNFSFYSPFQSGAFRMQNGNTIVTVTDQDFIFEINQDLEIVWEYNYTGNGHIARLINYEIDLIVGDINYDILLDVTDLVILIDIILDNPNYYINIINNDLNGDGSVNIYDIIFLVNLIL